MLPIRGVYEVAIRVKDLSRAEAFYKSIYFDDPDGHALELRAPLARR